jgi:hypothetical protein
MKKIISLIVLITSIASAQGTKGTIEKGKISLMLNDTKFDLPISSIQLRKDEKTFLSVRAEENNEENQKLAALELTFAGSFLSKKDPEEIRLNFITKSAFLSTGEELSIHYPPSDTSEILIDYTAYEKGERMSWEVTSFNLVFNIDDVSFENNSIKIAGSFRGNVGSKLRIRENMKVIEIKDGKFEIII